MKVRYKYYAIVNLTNGKIYDVIYKSMFYYLILNDKGIEHTYSIGLFDDVSVLRDEKLENLGI